MTSCVLKMGEINGLSIFYTQIYLPLEANLWDASQNPSRVIFRRPIAACAKNERTRRGRRFLPTDLFGLQRHLVSMGRIDKSFKGDFQEVNDYMCAKNQRNRRGRRFLPTDLFGLLRPPTECIPKSFKGRGGAFLEKLVGQIDITMNVHGKKFGI